MSPSEVLKQSIAQARAVIEAMAEQAAAPKRLRELESTLSAVEREEATAEAARLKLEAVKLDQYLRIGAEFQAIVDALAAKARDLLAADVDWRSLTKRRDIAGPAAVRMAIDHVIERALVPTSGKQPRIADYLPAQPRA